MSKPDTASRIRQEFLALLDARPYDKISTKEIAEKAGVSRQTLYRHYRNKEEIIRAIFDDMFDEFYERAEPHFGTFDRNVAYAINILAYNVMAEHRESFMVLARSGADDIIYEQLRRYFRRLFGALLRHLNLTPNTEQMEFILDLLAGGGFRVLKRWALEGMKQSPEEMARLHALFFGGGALGMLGRNQSTD